MPPAILRVDPAVLRAALGAEVVLREGQIIGGRLAEVRGRHGILVLRGAPVVAELPEGLRAGQALRLAVEGAGEDGRVILRLAPEETAAPPAHAPVAPTPWVALPGGARARFEDPEPEPDAAGARGTAPADADARTVAVRFEGPALGPVELRLDLDAAGQVRALVRATPGAPLGALRDAVAELRRALGGDVRLEPRSAEVDLRA